MWLNEQERCAKFCILNHTQVTEFFSKSSARLNENLLNGISDQSCFSGFHLSLLTGMQLSNRENQCSLFSLVSFLGFVFNQYFFILTSNEKKWQWNVKMYERAWWFCPWKYPIFLTKSVKPLLYFCHKNVGGKKGVLVMALFPTVVIAYLGADFIKALQCTALSPVASCLPSTISSQQNTWINRIIILDRDRVKLQVKRENAFWQISVALVIPRYYVPWVMDWCSYGNKLVCFQSLTAAYLLAFSFSL